MSSIGTLGGSPERPALFFGGPEEFRAWLAVNHATAPELWMGLRKKHVADRGLTWEQAVPEALCFGWIDSVVQRIDDDTVRQRWTPRRPGSIWSSVNIALVEQLTAAGRMQPAGRAAYERRKPEKSGIYAYEKPGDIALPEPYAALLAASPVAAQWLAGATETYRRSAFHWVVSAKQQSTRDKRMAELIADSANGLLIKPQRYGSVPTWVRRNREALGLTDAPGPAAPEAPGAAAPEAPDAPGPTRAAAPGTRGPAGAAARGAHEPPGSNRPDPHRPDALPPDEPDQPMPGM